MLDLEKESIGSLEGSPARFLRFNHCPGNAHTAQIDAMNGAHHSFSPSCKTLRDALLLNARAIVGSWIEATNIHLHADDPSLVVTQKSQEQKRRDETRMLHAIKNARPANPKDELREGGCAAHSLDATPPGKKKHHMLLSARIEKRFLVNMLAAFCALVAVSLQWHRGSPRERASKKAFIHGIDLQISKDPLGVCLSKVSVHRACGEPFALALLKDSNRPKGPATIDGLELSPCDADMPWEVTLNGGFAQRPDMRARHGESETRFYCAMSSDITPDGKIVLADSCDTDCPAIATRCFNDRVSKNHIFHNAGSSFIDINKLKHACDALGIHLHTITRLYAVSGCEFIPGAQHFGKAPFLKVWLFNRRVIGNLKHFRPLRRLYLIMHFMRGRLLDPLPKKYEPREMWSESEEWGQGSDDQWADTMRQTIFFKIGKRIRAAADLPPQDEDLLLQLLRMTWVVDKRWGRSVERERSKRSRCGIRMRD